MKSLLHDIPSGSVDVLNVIIEVPRGSRVKYELDKETSLIKVDRIQFTAMGQPLDYGFVPQTYCEDGDPLDCLVLVSEPLVPGCLVEARPVGMLKMIDGGERDFKILCAAKDDVRMNNIKDLKDVNPHTLKEVQHFFEHYKDLQNKKVIVEGWENVVAAKKEIERSFALYKKQKK